MVTSLPLLVLAGPTGTGKTALAVQLAQKLETTVISADSRQVYRDFDLGTAKPTLEEQGGVPHELLDVADPRETYTVAQYQQAAREHIARLHRQGKIPILCGGTGLYIQAVTEGLHLPPVPPDPQLRAQLNLLTDAQLHAQLQTQAPQAAERIHGRDRVRMLRALEILHTLGYLPERTQDSPPYPVLRVGLDCPDLARYTRQLTTRTEAMLARGWLEEIQQLQAIYSRDLPLLKTLGYAQMARHLTGEYTREEAVAETVLRTRQYAKRQRTWFRRYRDMVWFDPIGLPSLVNQILTLLAAQTQPMTQGNTLEN
ncbi:tRNA (adenosine(37)-N6)-dimethylallyltransferase MiaA [Anthocerotibacter panamensis]|uniref:tRNA (adenosine(37)-N6)-dimethylallyltransferase MiaA n=1 Tax=Anthocerotibacter panamensis TaxID=2857077 RepID=UPI001C4061CA|nr:tRNA (adenosine(37)-N6)-dimethylallyltransferase MiaA [Anthocerotibacter panamensis]